MGVCNCSLFCCTLVYVHSSFAIILMGERELVALLSLSSWCLVILLCDSSSLCHEFVCSLWLWYFLIVLTIFEFIIFMIVFQIRKSCNSTWSFSSIDIRNIFTAMVSDENGGSFNHNVAVDNFESAFQDKVNTLEVMSIRLYAYSLLFALTSCYHLQLTF